MPHNNWTPVVLDLLVLLTQEGGASLLSVDDGGETTHLMSPTTCGELTEVENLAAEAITAVDNSTLRIMLGGETAELDIVLSNGPAEIVSDWSAPNTSRIYWMLKAITRKFSDQWEGKPCPVEDAPISDGDYRATARKLRARVIDLAVHFPSHLQTAYEGGVERAEDGSGAWVEARIWVDAVDAAKGEWA